MGVAIGEGDAKEILADADLDSEDRGIGYH